MSSLNNFSSLYVVGLGPGDSGYLAPVALDCLKECEVVCGYDTYIKLIQPELLQNKIILSTGMMSEVERSKMAVENAMQGKKTVMVCSGDPGIYALAGLVLEIIESTGYNANDFPLEIVPGIPAVCAAAALLGAPLMHDFAVISLSDLLTPWETIAKRLECAFQGDFVVALYNPRSKKRSEHLEKVIEIAKKYREKDTPVGIVRNAFRKNQSVIITPLQKVDVALVDMFTIVIIGNSTSRIAQGKEDCPLSWEHGARILTPRGYAKKYTNFEISNYVDTK